MNAISLWQPWASLWALGRSPKVYETRDWPTSVRGWVVVHAGKRDAEEDVSVDLARIARAMFGIGWRETLPRGAVVGAVRLEHCQPCDRALREFLGADVLATGNFAEGRYAWRRGDAVLFDEGRPFVGRQKIFQVPRSALPPSFLHLLDLGA